MLETFVCIFLLSTICITNGAAVSKYNCNPQADCGCFQDSATVSKIVGGEPVLSGAFGWAVSLRNQGSHTCGGSIISDSFVVTAAHCIPVPLGVNQLSVLAGTNLLSKQGQTRSVVQVYTHPDFNLASFTNDIAILRLASPLDLTDPNVQKICLPAATDNPTAGMDLTAIGWGVTQEGSVVASNELRQATLQVYANDAPECKVVLRSAVVQFCAGVTDGSKDSCSGDSGGPLMAFLNNRWIMMGLMSAGHGCGRIGFAAIYTRVPVFLDFIRSIVANV